MYHAHYRSTITVRDRAAFVPSCNEFRYFNGKASLLEPACACGHGLFSWPSGCGLWQAARIHRSLARRLAFFGGCACCRRQFDEFLPFRLGEGGGRRRIVAGAMKREGFDGRHEFGYGVELHNWVRETISLLMKFEGGVSFDAGDSNGLPDGASLLPLYYNLADEYGTSFICRKCSFSEEANICVNGTAKNVGMVVEGRNRASSFRYVRDDGEREDDERDTMLHGHSSSLKRRQGKHELRQEFSLRGKHSASNPKKTQKHNFAGTENASSRTRGHYGVTEDCSDKAECSIGASSVGKARGQPQKFFGDDRYSNEERAKRQEISGDVQRLSRSDEIKVSLVDKENERSSSSTSVSRHKERISMKMAGSQVESRNVVGESSGSVDRSSSSYGTAQIHVDGNWMPRQGRETRSMDNVESGVTEIDAHYTFGKEQSVFVNEADVVSTSFHSSARTLEQNQEKTVEGVASSHVPQQTDSSVLIPKSDLSKLHESKVYKTCRSSDTDCLQQTSGSDPQASARLHQYQISIQKMSTTSSSEQPVGISLNDSSGHQTAECAASDYVSQYQQHSNIKYMQELSSNRMLTGTKISEADQPGSHPSQRAKISLENIDAHKSDEYARKYVSRRHDLEYHQESRDNSTNVGANDSVQAHLPEISVTSSSRAGGIGSLNGSNGCQLPGYASNDDIAKHGNSVIVNYSDTQTDTTILGQIIFHEPPADPSSQLTFIGSPRTAGEHQFSIGSRTTEVCESQQIISDAIHVQPQGRVPPDRSEANDIVKQCSGPSIESDCSVPVILLEKPCDGLKHPSAGSLHPANSPSQRIVEKTEKMYTVERERSSLQTTALFQQFVLANPSLNSNADNVQGDSSENAFKDPGMQRSLQSSVSSGSGNQSDEIWATARETFEERSSMEKTPEIMITPVTPTSAAKLTVVTTKGTSVEHLGNPIMKRTGRKLWGYVAETIKGGWVSRAGTYNSKSKSAVKSSLTKSGTNETSLSGQAPEVEESQGKEKEGMLKEPQGTEETADALVSVASANNRQDISDNRSSRSMLVGSSKSDASSPMGLLAEGSIQEEASSISDPATHSASVGSLSVSVSGVVSSDAACSTNTCEVQQEEKISELPFTSPKFGRKNLDTGSHGPFILDRPEKDANNEDRKQALGSRKLRRAVQVERERFEAWEEAYKLEIEQRKMDEMFMRDALTEARKAADNWEVPIGAVLVQDGKILARGHNLVEELRDSTAHAEMLCIREASRMLRTWRLAETTLYVTLEPCPMCAGAILQARIGTLVWGAPNKLLGADGSWVRLFPSVDQGQDSGSAGPVHPFHPNMRVRRGILATECSDVMQQFFRLRRKRTKIPETSSPSPVTRTPANFFSKMHNIMHIFRL